MIQRTATYHQTADDLRDESSKIRAAQQDPAAFEALYKKYYSPVYLFVLKRIESNDEASDITSQVFLKALINLGKYRDMGVPFSAWLLRIARNILYDQYNAKKIQLVLSIENKGLQAMAGEMQTEEP